MKKGRVYLVGAGPGDEKLISVRGLELIEKADVIVYDRLVPEGLLSYGKAECEKIYAGKLPDRHTLRQEEMNRLLTQKAGEGKIVVRLKGGDPLIFGRGAEEGEELWKEGIPFEIVPGISSFYSAPAYAGIPVTYRECSSSFHVFTGHFKEEFKLDYKTVAALEGTLLFLMGMKNLSLITEGLMREGKDRNTPAAVIEWGTTPNQRECIGTLADISWKAEEMQMSHPSVIVIGDVVKEGGKLNWQKFRPLWGKKILLCRPKKDASVIKDRLNELGAQVTVFPTIEIRPAGDYSRLDCCITKLSEYNWLFFTSANGVSFFFQRLLTLNLDARALCGKKIFCIGSRTRQALEDRGILADYMPRHFNSIEGAALLKKILKKGDNILFPTSDIGRDILAEEARRQGALCDKVTAYETVPNPKPDKNIMGKIREGYYDTVVFASSSQAENYYALMGAECGGAKICSIGEMTTATAVSLGFEVACQSREASADSLIEAVKELLAV